MMHDYGTYSEKKTQISNTKKNVIRLYSNYRLSPNRSDNIIISRSTYRVSGRPETIHIPIKDLCIGLIPAYFAVTSL